MKAKQTLLTVLLGILTISAAQAQDFFGDHFCFSPGTAMFDANEFSLDLFGFHDSHDRNGNSSGAWGPGVGGNYFVTQYFGVGADTYADAFNRPYLLNGNAIFRYPFETIGLAPYAFAGAGRQWRYASQWSGDIGFGLEYRFAPKTSVFTDFRGVFAVNTSNYTVWRFGFRLLF